jgi:ubiquinone/menaquinone biosynthesis C-methylase UbiE
VPHTEANGHFLTPEQASRVYDRIGRFQDWQVVYEGSAIRELLRLGTFDQSRAVLEFGCGTGAFASQLLKTCLPRECRYIGIDVSPHMVQLATSRLIPWAERATIRLSDGSPQLDEPDSTFDRFVANYVLDLLAPDYTSTIIAEAYRVLRTGGKLCLLSLGHGRSGLPRIVTALWERVWHFKPDLVGGCRPIDLRRLLEPEHWSMDHYKTVVSFGITSEIVVASRMPSKIHPVNR